MGDIVDGELGTRFRALFRAYHSVIVAAAYNRLSSVSDAEDAAAEVFGAAWRRRDEHPGVFTLPWLYGTLRNIVGNEYRRRDRAARRAAAAQDELERHGTSSSGATSHGVDWRSGTAADGGLGLDEQAEIRAAVARLELADRELIWMAYWEELSRDEMAAVLGCSGPAVRVRLLRARNRLKAELHPGRLSVMAGDDHGRR